MSLNEEEREVSDRREFFKDAISGAAGAAAMVAAVSQLGVPVLNAAQAADAKPKAEFKPKPKPEYPPPWPKGTEGNRYSHLWSTKLRENTLVPDVIPSPQAYFRGDSDLPGAKLNMGWQIFVKPIRLEMESHHHDHDEYQFYLGATFPDLVGSFDAEIEVFLGKEYERHLITKACVLYLPAGFEHNPCDFRRVTKPVFFTSLDIAPFCHGVYQTMGWRAFRSSPKIA